ncbi:MAG: hypothetical protein M1838_005075 [Thelocarpon superellum]|nr:MAG: hypothetical protein M1838_005075 [Thelocarpon superellum]
MATSSDIPAYFLQREEAGYPVVHDLPKFDLDAYIANYTGRTRLDRLFLIGCTCPPLALEALKVAVVEATEGKDVAVYQKIVETIRQMAPNDPDAKPNLDWVERMEKQVKAETDRLEFELKGYKNNLIKESIRMGNEDLGCHYQAVGELVQASKAFVRMRDYCTSAKHIAEMCLKLIVVSIEQGNWMAVQSNTLKVRNLQLKAEDAAEMTPKICVAAGLAQLSSGRYFDAAQSFLQTDPQLANTFHQVLTANDVAVYGGVCALASMDRKELQTRVLENAGFRNYLELEPHIRRAITFFCNSKYSQCLEILDAYRADYLLDLRLQPHVASLYADVRNKCIVQYFIPFSCVSLAAMATAFATTEHAIEHELVRMIERGTLEARVDTQRRLLVAKQTDLRRAVHTDALAMARKYERMARLRLMRMNITTAGLDIKGSKSQPAYAPDPSSNGFGAGHGGMKAASGRR